jgi:RES domain-containing protein
MRLWRISAHVSLSGEGGLRYSARWHTAGHRIVYLAESPAGAMLETLVHLELHEATWPKFYNLIEVDVPASLEVETLKMPEGKDWKNLLSHSRTLGDEWLRSNRTPLARVPSAIMPSTWDTLLDPDHPASAQVRIIETHRAEYDRRLPILKF